MSYFMLFHLVLTSAFWIAYFCTGFMYGEHKTSLKNRILRMSHICLSRRIGTKGNVPEPYTSNISLNGAPIVHIRPYKHGKIGGFDVLEEVIFPEIVATIAIPYLVVFEIVYMLYGFGKMKKIEDAGFIFVERDNIPSHLDNLTSSLRMMVSMYSNCQVFLAPGMTHEEAMEKLCSILPKVKDSPINTKYGLIG